MAITRIKSGDRMSQAVVHNGIVSTAGQVAQNAKGASATDQTKDILKAIDELLDAAGTDKSNLLTATIWLSNIGDFAEMNVCLLYTSPSPRDRQKSRMPSSA